MLNFHRSQCQLWIFPLDVEGLRRESRLALTCPWGGGWSPLPGSPAPHSRCRSGRRRYTTGGQWQVSDRSVTGQWRVSDVSVTGQWQVSDRSVTGQWHVSYMSFSCVLPVVQIPVLSNNVDRSLQINFNCSLLRLDKHQYKWYSMKSYLCSQSPVTARNSV